MATCGRRAVAKELWRREEVAGDGGSAAMDTPTAPLLWGGGGANAARWKRGSGGDGSADTRCRARLVAAAADLVEWR